MESRLSLPAELLLVATDPNCGGLLPRRRRRFRSALAAAQGFARSAALAGWHARRRAHGELARAGVLAPGSTVRRPRLADRDARAAVLRRVRRCVRDEAAGEPRDRELLLLMASASTTTASGAAALVVPRTGTSSLLAPSASNSRAIDSSVRSSATAATAAIKSAFSVRGSGARPSRKWVYVSAVEKGLISTSSPASSLTSSALSE